MTKALVVDDQTFEQEVLNSDKPVLVDFWAGWSEPCDLLAPIFEEIADEHSNMVKFAKFDVDANPITATRFSVRSLPTIVVFKAGREVDRIIGYYLRPNLMQKLRPHLGMD
jgi:thioredoxin 1